jgi:hypothetical protein
MGSAADKSGTLELLTTVINPLLNTVIPLLTEHTNGSLLAASGRDRMALRMRRKSFLIAAVSIACLTLLCVSIASVSFARYAARRLLNHSFARGPAIISGELVDTYCWSTQFSGGPDHAAWAINCAKRGIPVAIVDQKSRRAFVLVPARNQISLPAGLIEAMGQQVTIRGELFERGGTEFATVRSWHRVRAKPTVAPTSAVASRAAGISGAGQSSMH